MTQIISAVEETFQSTVLKASCPVLVVFGNAGSKTDRRMTPVIEKIASGYTGQLKIVRIHAPGNKRLAGEYGITGDFCLILFDRGKEICRREGEVDPENIKNNIKNIMAKISLGFSLSLR